MEIVVNEKGENKDEFLVSYKDKEVFYNALMGEEHQPNNSLLEAIKFHDELIFRINSVWSETPPY